MGGKTNAGGQAGGSPDQQGFRQPQPVILPSKYTGSRIGTPGGGIQALPWGERSMLQNPISTVGDTLARNPQFPMNPQAPPNTGVLNPALPPRSRGEALTNPAGVLPPTGRYY